MAALSKLLQRSAEKHSHLCPRQVLGVRMGLLGIKRLELADTDLSRRLLVIMETDGCAADGVAAATGCTVGNRKLRILDYGKVAATFVDLNCNAAARITPKAGIRNFARSWAPEAKNRWHAQLEAYQIMPDGQLFNCQWVNLTISLERLLSKPVYRVDCQACGEEIINQREVVLGEKILCQACAGPSYYSNRNFNELELPETRSHPQARPARSAHLPAIS